MHVDYAICCEAGGNLNDPAKNVSEQQKVIGIRRLPIAGFPVFYIHVRTPNGAARRPAPRHSDVWLYEIRCQPIIRRLIILRCIGFVNAALGEWHIAPVVGLQ